MHFRFDKCQNVNLFTLMLRAAIYTLYYYKLGSSDKKSMLA